MSFFRTIFKDSRRENWSDGFQWLGWHLICGLMPIWITLILLRSFRQGIEVQVFTNNGEFALYSASFLGTCFYVVMKDFKKKSFPNRGAISLLLVPLLLFSALMYSMVALLNLLQEATNISTLLTLFDKEFLVSVTLFILPIVFLFTFLVIIADNVRTSPDLNRPLKNLNTEFDELGDR